MSRVPASTRTALVVALALGPVSVVPCSAIHVLPLVEIIDQSITPVKPRVDDLAHTSRGSGRTIQKPGDAQRWVGAGSPPRSPPWTGRGVRRRWRPAPRYR